MREIMREIMREMTNEELIRCKAFLDAFHVDYTKDVIELTDGGNSMIINPNTEWKEFLGYSINSIARVVAEKLGKKTIYKD